MSSEKQNEQKKSENEKDKIVPLLTEFISSKKTYGWRLGFSIFSLIENDSTCQ